MKTFQLTNNTTLYVSQIIDTLPDLAQYFGADTEEIVNRAQRQFKSKHRQWEWLTVRAILRHALGPDATIEYEESGKPLVLPITGERRGGLYISISHSKSHAALLLSTHKNIGVDIEQVSDRILRLADRIAQPGELPADWDTLTPQQQAHHLTTLWTIKEALYKSLDNQSSIDLLQLPIPLQTSDISHHTSSFRLLEHAGNIIAVISPDLTH